ncbi:MAG: L,D-transpeptidase family protein [Candidatus Paceibacterota bacterium]|jgi:hypothetical protein|nr:L,D-transpeptidase family protein [Candidatus Paceibacterota bacterium]MDD4875381.1 L,D-transpeptidase family protein [Candidatus Paceibacterota bacterium]
MAKISSIIIAFLAIVSGFLFYNGLKYLLLPEYAESYFASFASCSCQKNFGTEIKINFVPKEKAKHKIPYYEIQDLPEYGKSVITLHNVESIKDFFSYDEIVNSPLLSSLDYKLEGKNLLVELERKGSCLPLEIIEKEQSIFFILKSGNENYPIITDQKPADSGTASPGFKKISFKAVLKNPLKKFFLSFQGEPVNLSGVDISGGTLPYQYLFEFKANIEKDKEYQVKAIITDNQDQASIYNWTFMGQIPVEAALGKDRFKYLGWWGQINADGINVREEPSASSTKKGSLSSANRVKVLKEVSGQEIGDNNVWYEIDGGKYPHSYIFSSLVSPLPQPEPPQTVTAPDEVKEGEYWIDVNLSKKILTLVDYDKPVFATYVSIGREENPTPAGIFNVWYKLKKATMKGGPPLVKQKYELKNVPYVMYYQGSYAVHGTYWHDKFGTPQSAGCTNITQGDAAYIFEKTNPIVPADKNYFVSSKENPGVLIYNHE